MLTHFLNVSFTLPQALELDKGQDYWWLHVMSPLFYSPHCAAGEGEWGAAKWKVYESASDNTDPCVFILRTLSKRFNRECVDGPLIQ